MILPNWSCVDVRVVHPVAKLVLSDMFVIFLMTLLQPIPMSCQGDAHPDLVIRRKSNFVMVYWLRGFSYVHLFLFLSPHLEDPKRLQMTTWAHPATQAVLSMLNTIQCPPKRWIQKITSFMTRGYIPGKEWHNPGCQGPPRSNQKRYSYPLIYTPAPF